MPNGPTSPWSKSNSQSLHQDQCDSAWAWLRSEERAQPVSGISSALVLFGANTVVAVAATVGLASGLQGHDHHDGGHRVPVEAEGSTPGSTESFVGTVDSAHHEGGHQHDE